MLPLAAGVDIFPNYPSLLGGGIFDDFGGKKFKSKGNFFPYFYTLTQKFIDYPRKIIYFPKFSKYHQKECSRMHVHFLGKR